MAVKPLEHSRDGPAKRPRPARSAGKSYADLVTGSFAAVARSHELLTRTANLPGMPEAPPSKAPPKNA
ncbi:hypothetical protein [Dongia sp.]|uniref:hypothetical protein n=1 Tax=Dongia sp. TaxID=1977262 RepID=UPI003750993C